VITLSAHSVQRVSRPHLDVCEQNALQTLAARRVSAIQFGLETTVIVDVAY